MYTTIPKKRTRFGDGSPRCLGYSDRGRRSCNARMHGKRTMDIKGPELIRISPLLVKTRNNQEEYNKNSRHFCLRITPGDYGLELTFPGTISVPLQGISTLIVNQENVDREGRIFWGMIKQHNCYYICYFS